MNWSDNRRREALPIDARLGEILRFSQENQVVVVEAETGAGKTLRIGQAAILETPRLQVTLTQTRRAACRWNGKRIAWEMGEQPGETVGWSLFGQDPVKSRKTRLTLCMAQSLANRIRRSGGRLPEGLLIIDEAHERSVEVDLLLGLIKEALPSSPKTRVIVTSATIDTRKFSAFFDGAPVVSVKGRCFPVSTEVVRLQRYEHHSQGAARAARMVLDRFLKGSLQVPTENGECIQSVRQGAVIVLLPGKDDIRSVMAEISREAERLEVSDRVQVLSCHGESSEAEQDEAQKPVPAGTIRFICGTEILRSSVTVRGTIGVIDTLEVKRMVTDARGVGHLQKVTVSRAEADQAKGRAGRTAPGFYIPVSFANEYERLSPWPQPAILREPVVNVALQVAAVGRSMRDFAFIDAPPRDQVEAAIRKLTALGALDSDENITRTGEMLIRFPVDPTLAAVLIAADRLKVLPEAVVVAGILEAEGIFHPPKDSAKLVVEEPEIRFLFSHLQKDVWGGWRKVPEPTDPGQVDLSGLPDWVTVQKDRWVVDTGAYGCPWDGREIARLFRQHWAGESQSDFVAMARAYRAFKAKEWELRDRRDLNRRERDDRLRDWTFAVGLNLKRLRMAEDAMRQIREEVQSSPLRLENGFAQTRDFNAEALSKALASGLVDNLARKSERSDWTGRLGDFQLGRESCCAGEDLVLVGGVRKIPTKRGFFLLADTAAPIRAEWLHEVLPHLVTTQRMGDHVFDPERDDVVETERSLFQGDLELGQEKVPSSDDVATTIFAQWLAAQMV